MDWLVVSVMGSGPGRGGVVQGQAEEARSLSPADLWPYCASSLYVDYMSHSCDMPWSSRPCLHCA